MSDVNWYQVFSEAIAKVDAGLYQHPLAKRDNLIALACAEAVENRLPMAAWLQAQEDDARRKHVTIQHPTPSREPTPDSTNERNQP